MKQNNANVLIGLEEHNEPIRKGPDRDQFNKQDRLLSKWACMLHTSANGEIWHECKQITYCENCGEKTLICPHKLALNDAIIQVPPNTCVLKFSRPKLFYNQFLVRRALDGFKRMITLPDNDVQVGKNTSVLTNYKCEYSADPNASNETKNADAIRMLKLGNGEIGFVSRFICISIYIIL